MTKEKPLAIQIPEQFREAFGLPESLDPDTKLHPDLIPCIRSYAGFTVLSHPLLILPMFNIDSPMLVAMANKSYEAKLWSADEAMTKGDWSSYVIYHEEPYKTDALVRIAPSITDAKVYSSLLYDTWTYIENNYQSKDEWASLFSSPLFDPPLAMDDDDLLVFSALPEVVTVYRGYSSTGDDDGFSWTLDRDMAAWFAKRLLPEGDDCFVREITISKSKILFYSACRGEQEIVITDIDPITDSETLL